MNQKFFFKFALSLDDMHCCCLNAKEKICAQLVQVLFSELSKNDVSPNYLAEL